MGGLSALSEIKEYKYPSFPSFPEKKRWGRKRRRLWYFLAQLKKNFEIKVRLRVTKTYKHKKTQGLGALLEGESGRKEVFGRHL